MADATPSRPVDQPGPSAAPPPVTTIDSTVLIDPLEAALDYHRRGICVVPQRPGAKMPCIKWKPYQDTRPTVEELTRWFGAEFPDAGIALILGPVSNLFVVDVDGLDGHEAVVACLDRFPEAPTVLSGSGKPHRYHLYFRHPEIATQATYHPWCRGLEFRGYRGIVVAPPSVHKSGNRYTWAEGKSLDDLPLPEVPGPILTALRAKAATRTWGNPGTSVLEPLSPRDAHRAAMRIDSLAKVSLKTKDFLFGVYAHMPNWNSNLFLAACDLCGCGCPFEEAMELLLRGARPSTVQDKQIAENTIRSAYAEPRRPARELAATKTRRTFTLRFDPTHTSAKEHE